MSIDCTVEGQMGRAFVDDMEAAAVYKIEIWPFFYLAGDATGPGARTMLEAIRPYTLFMPSAPGWVEAGKQMYGERLTSFERHSFSQEQVSAEHLDQLCQASPFRGDVRRMDETFAAQLWGQDHFVDLSAFDSAEDFLARGIGFYLERAGVVVAAAYSSLVCSRGIEVSLFVEEAHRRQGIGTVLAARLVAWCLAHNAQANWDAANPESCALAEKLGYTPAGAYQAHYLKSK
jgi:GNAT superfamily N-acetyltransferase